MPTWMVVEDEPDLYDTLLMFFEIWGVDGVAFTIGTDAIQWIDDVDRGVAGQGIPELALLDIRLPGATGPEIGERLRSSPTLHSMAVVLTTAYYLTQQEERQFVAQAGADAVIYKPLPKPNELRLMLQEALEHRRSRSTAAHDQPPAPLRVGRAPAPTAPRTGDGHRAPSRLASSSPAVPSARRARRLAPLAELPPRHAVPPRRRRSVWGWLARGVRRLLGLDRD